MKNLYASKPSSKSNDFKMTPTISNIDSNLLSIIINFNGYKINYAYIYIYSPCFDPCSHGYTNVD